MSDAGTETDEKALYFSGNRAWRQKFFASIVAIPILHRRDVAAEPARAAAEADIIVVVFETSQIEKSL